MESMHVIDIDAAGGIVCMHEDSLKLGELGQQTIYRASEIKFDICSQKWGVHLALPDGGFKEPSVDWSGFDTYDGARRFEVESLNTLRLLQIDPLSAEAIPIIQGVRRAVAGL